MSDATLDIYYRFACCALTSAEALLEVNEIPLPTRREVLAHDFDDVCCNALLVRVGDSRNADVEGDECVTQRSTTFEVYYSRCVQVNAPGQNCREDDVACVDALVCPGEEPHPRPQECDPAQPKAHETLALMEDRWLFETYLAEQWKACLCSDTGCAEGCGDTLSCRRIRWVATRTHDSGGCGGFVAEYEVLWP